VTNVESSDGTPLLSSHITIGTQQIGKNHPVFVIAEAGVNHNGDMARAREMVHAAADAGADAIKFQTFSTESLVSLEAPKPEYQIHTTGSDSTWSDVLKELELNMDAHRELFDLTTELGMIFLSTPFDEVSADNLEGLGVPAFKIASPDLTNIPLLEHIARKGKPVILSTGMSTLDEVKEGISAITGCGNDQIIPLHCLSSYPAPTRDVNLRAMGTMRGALSVDVGYSDHTLGGEIAIAAVAMGAVAIEKHFTMDRNLPGPDHPASLEPDELADMIQSIRNVENALGNGNKIAQPSELDTARTARRSLAAAIDIPANTVIGREMIIALRPGTGIQPRDISSVIGQTTVKAVQARRLLGWDDFDGNTKRWGDNNR
jgi:N,N'-diacetyllegionaminate synthase